MNRLALARICANRRCGEWLDGDARFGLCPSCWFIARVGFVAGSVALFVFGAIVSFLAR